MYQTRTRAVALGLSFRIEVEKDVSFLTELYGSTRAKELTHVPWTTAQKAAFLAQQFQAQRSHYRKYYAGAVWLIVERAGSPIGRLYLDFSSREVRIIDITLAPAARAKGFGTALLQDVIEEATLVGKSVSIHVERMNPAFSLYSRLGFQEIEDKGVYLLMEHPGGAADLASAEC